ncbi:haloacid dehalogenase-like hydrolase domain-containing protein Sgpp [Vigna umbellata]|uniref:haloacid dehalogenase-like hydrolase domain-containing protein Sgpp n=1 Tax=Vigna umbellata TaxID=87088 RepID=UPI001F5F173C|nr:haloacid dehalogenase-like hydrolase domain-containing protein Sgpp [Vigna umbellata]
MDKVLVDLMGKIMEYEYIRSCTCHSLLLSSCTRSQSSLTKLAPLEAVLFELDGTICESLQVHTFVLRNMLQEMGFNADTVTKEFLYDIVVGKTKDEIALSLFPDDLPRRLKFMEDEEAQFRKEVTHVWTKEGFGRMRRWIERRKFKRAAVTNASRAHAEFIISKLGLSDFFDAVITKDECEHGKPHPEPYLKALEALKASKDHSLVFEGSFPGVKAGVAAGMPVISLDFKAPFDLLMEAKPAFVIKNYKNHKFWDALYELEKAGRAPSV